MSCSFVEAHSFLHSFRHSTRVFWYSPLGLVHWKTHSDRHASKFGSFFVPFKAGSTSCSFGFSARAGWTAAADDRKAVVAAAVVAPTHRDKNFDRD